jgi:phosphoglycerate dehydrogenase-like enzyme
MRTLLTLIVLAGSIGAQEKKIVFAYSAQHAWAVTDAAMHEYRGAAPGVKIVVAKSPGDLAREVVDADGVVGGVNPEQFRAAKKLKWVQVYSAGVEAYRWPEFLNSNVVLTNCKVVQGPTIADHAMAMLLAFTRGLHRYIPGRTKEQWERSGEGLNELGGMTAVVIGVGGIGSQIAQRAHAFGMRVIGVDPKDMPIVPFVSRWIYPDRLDSVLPEADVVFVAAPHTPQSENMMGPGQFELMKRDSYFIAVSRGNLYDTNALVKALDSKRVAGAGLDVTNPEPLPPGHPLWKFENVIITPHVASQAPGSRSRRVNVIKENIGRFTRGEIMLNVVDKVKGY